MGEGELFRIAYIFSDIIMPIGVGYFLTRCLDPDSHELCSGLVTRAGEVLKPL